MNRQMAFSQAWWQQRGLTAMLILLALMIFVALPLETLGVVSPWVVAVVTTLLLVSGVFALSSHRSTRVAMAVVAMAALAARWITLFRPSRAMAVWDLSLAMLAIGVFTAFVLGQVFRAGTITPNRIYGSILGYLLLGVFWCFAYQLIHNLVPDTFHFPAPSAPVPGRLNHQLVYFSYITLTTVGYGDITPVGVIARTLATAEGLVGQLYPAILIARLVSLRGPTLGS